MTSGSISVPNSVPTAHVASSLRPVSNINPGTQSKLTGNIGLSTVKTCGFGQNTTVQGTQEGCQDKQIEQAKLVSSHSTFSGVFLKLPFKTLSSKMVISIIIFIFISKESQVHQRISDLRKEGQWSASRLPKLVEASRPKSHWDYLLEEMQWMAADFAQERRWKEAAAKKVQLDVFIESSYWFNHDPIGLHTEVFMNKN